MKVVLDTNILASGIFFGGLPGKILDAWLRDVFVVYATPKILEEYIQVLTRMNTEAKEEAVFQWLESLSELCHVVSDVESKKPISRDPADDKFLYCALSAGADYLITGDQDLKVLEGSWEFKIASPRAFLNVLKNK